MKSISKIKKLNLLSFARFQGLLGALLGFLAGIVYSFGGLVVDTLVTLGLVVTTETPGLSYGTVLAFGALFGMPIIGLVGGLVIGFVSAILYNLYAKRFGGIDLDVD
jgi:hypothetical protein